jgi:hypothetical protein
MLNRGGAEAVSAAASLEKRGVVAPFLSVQMGYDPEQAPFAGR